MAKKKSKKQSRMDQLIGAAEELNELMGLKPPIPTEDVEEGELEELLVEARGMLKPGEDDDLSKKTVKVLDSIEIPEEEEEDEPEEEEETAEEEEPEELSIDDLLEEVKATKKRKELVEIIEDEEAFEGMGSISKLRSGKALQGAMIKHLKSLGEEAKEEPEDEPEEEVEEPEEAEEAAEEPAEEEKPKKAKSKKSSKKGGKKAAKKTGKKSSKKGGKKSTKKSSTKKDKKDKPGKTDFGHSATSQAGKIDNYLIENEGKEVSINDVAEASDAREARVKSHLRHLAKNKGLDIEYTEEDDETFVTYTA